MRAAGWMLLSVGIGLSLMASSESAQFDPKSGISACVLWLDATDRDADGQADAAADGAAVAEWRDKSGQDHHAVQTAEGAQPKVCEQGIGGKPALRFDGKDSLLDPLTRDWTRLDWTVIVVASLDADAPNSWRGIVGNRFGAGAGRWWTLGTKSDGTNYLELCAGGGVGSSLRAGEASACVYSVVKSGMSFDLFRGGVKVGSAKKDNVGGLKNELRIGRWYGEDQGWQGNIAELLIYDRALTTADRVKLEEYLAEKWSVPAVPDLYKKQAGWAETMVASRNAFTEYVASAANDPTSVDTALSQLWQQVSDDFPHETGLFVNEAADGRHLAWFEDAASVTLERSVIENAGTTINSELAALLDADVPASDPRWLNAFLKAAETRRRFGQERARLAGLNLPALRRAVDHLSRTYPEAYTKGMQHLDTLAQWEKNLPAIEERLTACDDGAIAEVDRLAAFRREALLGNPLLDFDRLLIVRRSLKSRSLGLPQNWQSNCVLPRSGFDNEIAALSLAHLDEAPTTVYRPEAPAFVGDVDLHFDGDRMLFSSIGAHERWQIFEVGMDGSGLRQVTPGDEPDVDNYDACYLPDDDIIFCSSAYFAAVPCVNGSTRTANLYRMRPDGSATRQLCFDQEHNWCPTMLPNGRVMYLRWEYTDTPHSHDRVLFHMDPDGTAQMEYYGSNSYWPNSLFYARPIPGNPTQFVGIVGGHHGVPRMGELVLFDVAQGRRESAGALQRIPGYGVPVVSETDPKYESTLIQDQLVDASWPKYLHPYPLSGEYFLVACQPTAGSLWGVYLVDTFDNMLLLREEPGYALFEPVPVRTTSRPPVLPDKVQPDRKDAVVYLADVYAGDGLKGIPRGTVKQLRVITYHFLYPGMGGPQAVVGMEGPWDIKRVLGTVPVEQDGSAMFRIPANTPVAVQPLDAEGKAVQLMRSWFTGMPGEVLSCVGCHESQSSVPPTIQTLASRRAPSELASWYGPTRGFNFEREVQPVLDEYCTRCHDGSERPDGTQSMDLATRAHITDYKSVFHSGGRDAGHFSVSYANLHRFVRRPGLESDYHLLMPMEFHADTTQLVQMLRKGHGNVQLDAESWDRIITWIDLNAPYHGTWKEIAGEERAEKPARRRRELLAKYAGVTEDPEAILPTEHPLLSAASPSTFQAPTDSEADADAVSWAFDGDEAKRQQHVAAVRFAAATEGGDPTTRTIDLGDGCALELVLVPAGEFVMGDADGWSDEQPATPVRIDEPFWMGRFEVTNALYNRFDPEHDSRVESRFSMQFGVRGFYVNAPEQPVVRVSWGQAMAFCAWLSEQTGEPFSLPTEAQWEYACRAGTDTPLSFGDVSADFSPFANLADTKLREFVCHTYKKEREPWLHASKYDDWIPKDTRFDDGGFLSEAPGRYAANAWGLFDMHGNVSEWTRSMYRPYPYRNDDGRNSTAEGVHRVVRGGSWRDRPKRARSAFRLPYRPYQAVYNVGFRVVCPVRQTKDADSAEPAKTARRLNDSASAASS